MPVPETTSAEALDRYAVGKKISGSKGPAWRDVQLSVISLPPVAEVFTMPSVNEPFIVWTTSGEAETQERENNGPWLTSRVKKGSLFLTAAGAPYDFRYRTLTPEPGVKWCSCCLACRFSTRPWQKCLAPMQPTHVCETCPASKTRTSFPCCNN